MKIINKIPTNKTVIIAPLDWGLGHATRCIPIILTLLKQQNKVFVCASGAVKKLLEADCPDAHFISFPGYNIHYNKRFGSVIFSLFWQLPKIAYKAIEEYYRLKKLVKSIRPSLIISDNRLGFRHKKIRSVYITHQLSIETGNRFLNRLAQYCHYSYLNDFHECWVPDQKGDESLAGKLSKPRKMPRIPVHYIGWLSRFTPVSIEKKYQAVIVISGPEPQRQLFEESILNQLNQCKDPVALVRGLPDTNEVINTPEHVVVFNHLPALELCQLMQEAYVVIARSGYSTIMDLIAMEQKAVLIPTPGQTEQEYLAKHLSHHRLFSTVSQSNFDLSNWIKNS